MDERGFEEQDVYPVGPFTAWATPDGMTAEVRDDAGRVRRRFKGETAWSDSTRHAGDENALIKSKKRG